MPARASTTHRSNLSQSDWLLRRLADAGERMTGPREIVINALAAQFLEEGE